MERSRLLPEGRFKASLHKKEHPLYIPSLATNIEHIDYDLTVKDCAIDKKITIQLCTLGPTTSNVFVPLREGEYYEDTHPFGITYIEIDSNDKICKITYCNKNNVENQYRVVEYWTICYEEAEETSEE